MKTIILLDTETIGLEKRYMYDIGYIIARKNEEGIYIPIEKKQFIIDQVYNNKMLFETAYYNEKRPRYISLLKGRKARMKKMGYALRIMKNDIMKYDVDCAVAYNAPFDTGVLEFNSNLFNLINPIEHLNHYDIQNLANKGIHSKEDYKKFCQNNNYITPSNNLKVNAEITYRFLTKNNNFIESHTGLQDCEIELDILNHCVKQGLDITKKYGRKFINSETEQNFKIIVKDENKVETEHNFYYNKKINSKKRNAIILEK